MTRNCSCFYKTDHAKNPFMKTIRSCFYFFYLGRGIFLCSRYKNRSCKITRSCLKFMLKLGNHSWQETVHVFLCSRVGNHLCKETVHGFFYVQVGKSFMQRICSCSKFMFKFGNHSCQQTVHGFFLLKVLYSSFLCSR
jgi:hypothetical protein